MECMERWHHEAEEKKHRWRIEERMNTEQHSQSVGSAHSSDTAYAYNNVVK